VQVISSPTKKGAVGALTSGTDVERGILGEDLLTSGVVALIRLQEICGSIRRAKISPFDNRLNQTDATINGVIDRVERFGKSLQINPITMWIQNQPIQSHSPLS
jgi:hypothetical protein